MQTEGKEGDKSLLLWTAAILAVIAVVAIYMSMGGAG